MNASNVFSILALVASASSIIISYTNNQRFASHQFINKQIDVIADLVTSLHNDLFKVDFIPKFSLTSKFSHFAEITLFDASRVRGRGDKDVFPDLGKTPIYFPPTSNQLVKIKDFINNPYLPKSIADALFEFYSVRTVDVQKEAMEGHQMIVITTAHFERGSIADSNVNNNLFKQPDANALYNWQSFLENIGKLELTIETFLKSKKVSEINIRRDLKNIYVG